MGLIQKRDERDVVSGIEIIERSDVPGDLPKSEVDIVAGSSAEDIAAEKANDRPGSAAVPLSEALGDKEATEEVGGAGRGAPTEDPATGAVERDADPTAADATEQRPAVESTPATLDEVIPDDQPACGEFGSGGPGAPGGSGGADGPAGPDGPATGGSDGPGRGSFTQRILHRRTVVIAAIAVVIVGVVAHLALSGFFTPHGIRTTSLAENQLDTTVAAYDYNGQHHDITARDAVSSQFSLDMAKDADGVYQVPSVEAILSSVRSKILTDIATDRGITVSDQEMSDYAQTKLQLSDYASIAARYKVSEEQAKKIIKEQVLIQKLYKQVVGDTSGTSMPDPPEEPANGDGSTASKEYADYIIKLAGDEWDAEKGTWASESGPFYTALKGQQFTADSATYDQAMNAYYVAYQQLNDSSEKSATAWTDFQNDLFSKVDITFYGIYV